MMKRFAVALLAAGFALGSNATVLAGDLLPVYKAQSPTPSSRCIAT